MAAEKPKGCPFCGEMPDVNEMAAAGIRVGWRVACSGVAGCATCPETRVEATREDAIARWNTRAGEGGR